MCKRISQRNTVIIVEGDTRIEYPPLTVEKIPSYFIWKLLSALTTPMKIEIVPNLLTSDHPSFEILLVRNRTRSAGILFGGPRLRRRHQGGLRMTECRTSDAILCFFILHVYTERRSKHTGKKRKKLVSIKENRATKATHLNISEKHGLTPYPQGPPAKALKSTECVNQQTNMDSC